MLSLGGQNDIVKDLRRISGITKDLMICLHTRKLKCWMHREVDRKKCCPFRSWFWDILENWVFNGRAPRAINLDAGSGRYNQERPDLLFKAEVYRLFQNSNVVHDVVSGEAPMTHEVCRDLISGKKVWIQRNWCVKYDQPYKKSPD